MREWTWIIAISLLMLWGVMTGVIGGICDPTPSPDSVWPPCE